MSELPGQLKINLGCGRAWNPDWENVDSSPYARLSRLRRWRVFSRLLPQRCKFYPPAIIVRNARRLPLPFADGSAAVIYSGSLLEFLTVEEAQALGSDCRRILRPGGLIRLTEIDAKGIVDRYLQRYRSEPSKAAVQNVQDLFWYVCPAHNRLLLRLFARGGWQSLWDRPAIAHLLAQAGFEQIAFYDLHQGQCPDLTDIERVWHDELPFFHVEARKAGAV